MVTHYGYCPSLRKKVDFSVSEVIDIPTRRGIKYQIKGNFEGRLCNTFCSATKAAELRSQVGSPQVFTVMEAEESQDNLAQATQEDDVPLIIGPSQRAYGQEGEAAEALPIAQTIPTPIISADDMSIQPIDDLSMPDVTVADMQETLDVPPTMDANFEIAEMQPEGDGSSIGNITPMNPDAPLHAEDFDAEESQENLGQATQEESVPAIIGPSQEAYGQEGEAAEELPLAQTVPTPIISAVDMNIVSNDSLSSFNGGDILTMMESNLGERPEIMADFAIRPNEPFGDGRSIGNIAPMNPDVPFASEDDDDEVDMNKIANMQKYFMDKLGFDDVKQLEDYFEKMDEDLDDDDFDAETLSSQEIEEMAQVPPPVCFVEKIPPEVWANTTIEAQKQYAETKDEGLLNCPQCGISKANLRSQGGYCGTTDPEGEAYIQSRSCPYNKYFAPQHWIDEPQVISHITPNKIVLEPTLTAEMDMPPINQLKAGITRKLIPTLLFNRINDLLPQGVVGNQTPDGRNYELTYYAMDTDAVNELVNIEDNQYDIMFGAEEVNGGYNDCCSSENITVYHRGGANYHDDDKELSYYPAECRVCGVEYDAGLSMYGNSSSIQDLEVSALGAETFEAQRIQYDYMVHREPSGTEVGADGKRITNPRGGRFTSADAESFNAETKYPTTFLRYGWKVTMNSKNESLPRYAERNRNGELDTVAMEKIKGGKWRLMGISVPFVRVFKNYTDTFNWLNSEESPFLAESFEAESKKKPSKTAEKAILTGASTGATMEIADALLAAETFEDSCPICGGEIFDSMEHGLMGYNIAYCDNCDLDMHTCKGSCKCGDTEGENTIPIGNVFCECGFGQEYGSRTPCESCEPISEKIENHNTKMNAAETFEAESRPYDFNKMPAIFKSWRVNTAYCINDGNENTLCGTGDRWSASGHGSASKTDITCRKCISKWKKLTDEEIKRIEEAWDRNGFSAESFKAPRGWGGRMSQKRRWNDNHVVWASDSKLVRQALKEQFPDYKFGVSIIDGQYIQVVVKSGNRPANLDLFREEVETAAMKPIEEAYEDSPEELRDKSVYVMAYDSDFNAESFNVEFDDWADQEMKTHGDNISFKKWAKEEGKKHGDVPITDWAEHEEDSHDERYGAEDCEHFWEVARDGENYNRCLNCGGTNQGDGWLAENYRTDNCIQCGRFNESKCDECDSSLCEDCALTPDEVPVFSDDSAYVSETRNELNRKYEELCKGCVDELTEYYKDDSYDAETFESQSAQTSVKPSLKSIGILLGIGAIAAVVAPENLKKMFKR